MHGSQLWMAGYSRAMACFEPAPEPPQRAAQSGRHPELAPAAGIELTVLGTLPAEGLPFYSW